MAKKIISLILSVTFFVSNISFAQDAVHLAPPSALDDIANASGRDSFVNIALMALTMELTDLDNSYQIAGTQDCAVIKDAWARRERVNPTPNDRKVKIFLDQAQPLFSEAEAEDIMTKHPDIAGIRTNIFIAPAILRHNGERHDYRLLFTTVRNPAGEFEAQYLTPDKLKQLKSRIIEHLISGDTAPQSKPFTPSVEKPRTKKPGKSPEDAIKEWKSVEVKASLLPNKNISVQVTIRFLGKDKEELVIPFTASGAAELARQINAEFSILGLHAVGNDSNQCVLTRTFNDGRPASEGKGRRDMAQTIDFYPGQIQSALDYFLQPDKSAPKIDSARSGNGKSAEEALPPGFPSGQFEWVPGKVGKIVREKTYHAIMYKIHPAKPRTKLGKSPEDALKVILRTGLEKFTLDVYMQAYERGAPELGFEPGISETTARRDLSALAVDGCLLIDRGVSTYTYTLTAEGKNRGRVRDVMQIIAMSGLSDFTSADYLGRQSKLMTEYGIAPVTEDNEEAARRDLAMAASAKYLLVDGSGQVTRYKLAEKGKAEVRAMQARYPVVALSSSMLPSALIASFAVIAQGSTSKELVRAILSNEALTDTLLATDNWEGRDNLRETLVKAQFGMDVKQAAEAAFQLVTVLNEQMAGSRDRLPTLVVANALMTRWTEDRKFMQCVDALLRQVDPTLAENLKGLLDGDSDVQFRSFNWLFDRLMEEAEMITADPKHAEEHEYAAKIIVKQINKILQGTPDRKWSDLRNHIILRFAEELSKEFELLMIDAAEGRDMKEALSEHKPLMAAFLRLYPEVSNDFFLAIDTCLVIASKDFEAKEKTYANTEKDPNVQAYERFCQAAEVLLSYSCLVWPDKFFDYLKAHYQYSSSFVKAHYLTSMKHGIYDKTEEGKRLNPDRVEFIVRSAIELCSDRDIRVRKMCIDVLRDLREFFIQYISANNRYQELDITRRGVLLGLILRLGMEEIDGRDAIEGGRARVLPFIMHEMKLEQEDNMPLRKDILRYNYFSDDFIRTLDAETGRAVRATIIKNYLELKKDDIIDKNCKRIMASFGFPAIMQAHEYFMQRIGIEYAPAIAALSLSAYAASLYYTDNAKEADTINGMLAKIAQLAGETTEARMKAISAYFDKEKECQEKRKDLEGLREHVARIVTIIKNASEGIKENKDKISVLVSSIKWETQKIDSLAAELNGLQDTLKASLWKTRIKGKAANALNWIAAKCGFKLKKKAEEAPKEGDEARAKDKADKILRRLDWRARKWLRTEISNKQGAIATIRGSVDGMVEEKFELEEDVAINEERQVAVAGEYAGIGQRYEELQKWVDDYEGVDRPEIVTDEEGRKVAKGTTGTKQSGRNKLMREVETASKKTVDIASILRLYLSGPAITAETAKRCYDSISMNDAQALMTRLDIAVNPRFAQSIGKDEAISSLTGFLPAQAEDGIYLSDITNEIKFVTDLWKRGLLIPQTKEDPLVKQLTAIFIQRVKMLKKEQKMALLTEELAKEKGAKETASSVAIDQLITVARAAGNDLTGAIEDFLNMKFKKDPKKAMGMLFSFIVAREKFGDKTAVFMLFYQLSGEAGCNFITPEDKVIEKPKNKAELVEVCYRKYYDAVKRFRKRYFELEAAIARLERGYGWDTQANTYSLHLFMALFLQVSAPEAVNIYAEGTLVQSFLWWLERWKKGADKEVNVMTSDILTNIDLYIETAAPLYENDINARVNRHNQRYVLTLCNSFAAKAIELYDKIDSQDLEAVVKILEKMERIVPEGIVLKEGGEEIRPVLRIRDALNKLKNRLDKRPQQTFTGLPGVGQRLGIPFNQNGPVPRQLPAQGYIGGLRQVTDTTEKNGNKDARGPAKPEHKHISPSVEQEKAEPGKFASQICKFLRQGFDRKWYKAAEIASGTGVSIQQVKQDLDVLDYISFVTKKDEDDERSGPSYKAVDMEDYEWDIVNSLLASLNSQPLLSDKKAEWDIDLRTRTLLSRGSSYDVAEQIGADALPVIIRLLDSSDWYIQLEAQHALRFLLQHNILPKDQALQERAVSSTIANLDGNDLHLRYIAAPLTLELLVDKGICLDKLAVAIPKILKLLEGRDERNKIQGMLILKAFARKRVGVTDIMMAFPAIAANFKSDDLQVVWCTQTLFGEMVEAGIIPNGLALDEAVMATAGNLSYMNRVLDVITNNRPRYEARDILVKLSQVNTPEVRAALSKALPIVLGKLRSSEQGTNVHCYAEAVIKALRENGITEEIGSVKEADVVVKPEHKRTSPSVEQERPSEAQQVARLAELLEVLNTRIEQTEDEKKADKASAYEMQHYEAAIALERMAKYITAPSDIEQAVKSLKSVALHDIGGRAPYEAISAIGEFGDLGHAAAIKALAEIVIEGGISVNKKAVQGGVPINTFIWYCALCELERFGSEANKASKGQIREALKETLVVLSPITPVSDLDKFFVENVKGLVTYIENSIGAAVVTDEKAIKPAAEVKMNKLKGALFIYAKLAGKPSKPLIANRDNFELSRVNQGRYIIKRKADDSDIYLFKIKDKWQMREIAKTALSKDDVKFFMTVGDYKMIYKGGANVIPLLIGLLTDKDRTWTDKAASALGQMAKEGRYAEELKPAVSPLENISIRTVGADAQYFAMNALEEMGRKGSGEAVKALANIAGYVNTAEEGRPKLEDSSRSYAVSRLIGAGDSVIEALPELEKIVNEDLIKDTDTKKRAGELVRGLEKKICEEAFAAIPAEYVNNGMDVASLMNSLAATIEKHPAAVESGTVLIFSERVTFDTDNGVGVFLSKLAGAISASGARVAVVATKATEEQRIDELNEGKSENERIVYAPNVAAVTAKVKVARYHYYKVEGDPEETTLKCVTTFDITAIFKKIIEMIGNVCGVTDSVKIEELHNAQRKFAQAA